MTWKKIIDFLTRVEHSREFWFMLATSVVFFFLRLPSLYEPYWYADEGIYQVIGYGLQHGRSLYTGVWDNKPPLLYVVYGLFNGSQFSIKLASLLVGLLTVIAFFYVAKQMFHTQKAVFVATAAFTLLFGIPVLEGNIANAENFLLLPILLGALLLLNPKTYENKRHLFYAGILLSIAFLFKVVALFDALAFITFLFMLHYTTKKRVTQELKTLLPLGYGFILPIILTTCYFIFAGALLPYLQASFTQNVGYVGWGNTFFIPHGLLIIKTAILALIVFLLFKKRGKLPHYLLFILLWLSFALFDSLFSQRGFTHYLLMSLPSFSLLLGALAHDRARRYFLLLLTLFVVWLAGTNFTIYQPVLGYYTNFFSFITNHETTTEYRSFFDPNTPKRYAIANFIISHTKSTDNVFVWSNDAEIYRLARKLPPGRFSVAYHIIQTKSTIQETRQAFEKAKPKYVIITPVKQAFTFPLSNYRRTIILEGATIYERI